MRCVDVTVRTQILTRARVLVAKGWVQVSSREGNSFCVMGALEEAAYEHGFTQFRTLPWNPLCRALGLPSGDTLIAYNDLPSTTQEDILFLLDEWIMGAQALEAVLA